jgi:TetR/AcrR family transcriptional regulator, repressor for uid operon
LGVRERRLRKANQNLIDSRIQHILEAALRCFARGGFSAASMRDIAKEAGVSLGLLYRYFDDKAAIVGAAIKADSGEFRLRLDDLAASGLTNKALLAFLEREVILRSEATMFALTSEIVAEAARNPAIAGLIRENIETAEFDLAETLLALPGLRERPQSRKAAVRLASHLLGLIDLLTMRVFLGLRADPRTLLRSALENPDP